MSEFIIDFTSNGISYSGLVTPISSGDELHYAVVVESENQELHLEIIADNCGEGKLDWCYKESGNSQESNPYDKAFLQEIGEAIEKHETYP
jgi:hypothetical protein